MGAPSHTREGPELRVWPQRVPRLRGGRGVGLCRTGDEGSERAAGRGWPDTPDGLPQPGAVQFPGLRWGLGGSAGGGVVASRAWTGCRRPGERAWPAARHAPGPWRAPSPSRRGERDGPLPTARKSGGAPRRPALRSLLSLVIYFGKSVDLRVRLGLRFPPCHLQKLCGRGSRAGSSRAVESRTERCQHVARAQHRCRWATPSPLLSPSPPRRTCRPGAAPRPTRSVLRGWLPLSPGSSSKPPSLLLASVCAQALGSLGLCPRLGLLGGSGTVLEMGTRVGGRRAEAEGPQWWAAEGRGDGWQPCDLPSWS